MYLSKNDSTKTYINACRIATTQRIIVFDSFNLEIDAGTGPMITQMNRDEIEILCKHVKLDNN
jgi:hypothetical protein